MYLALSRFPIVFSFSLLVSPDHFGRDRGGAQADGRQWRYICNIKHTYIYIKHIYVCMFNMFGPSIYAPLSSPCSIPVALDHPRRDGGGAQVGGRHGG